MAQMPSLHDEASIPHFVISANDEYIRPTLGSLVSYIWHREPEEVYRTGVMCSNLIKGDGRQTTATLRFFDGYREDDGEPTFYSGKFYFSEKKFKKKAMFRVRWDLKVGSTCYNAIDRRWCILTKIDMATGGVYVQYQDKGCGGEELISPDHLHGLNCLQSTAAGRPNLRRLPLHRTHGNISQSNKHQHRLQGQEVLAQPQPEKHRERGDESRGNGTAGIVAQEMDIGDPDSIFEAEGEELGDLAGANADFLLDLGGERNGEGLTELEREMLIDDDDVDDNNEETEDGETNDKETSDEYENVVDAEREKEHDEAEVPPPAFEIDENDPYVKPQPGELITCQYHEDFYRVGVVGNGSKGKKKKRRSSEKVDLRFLGTPGTFQRSIDAESFRQGLFRARPELKPGCRCYDAEHKAFCVLKAINKRNGAVCVQFDSDEEEREISPDFLVAVPKKPHIPPAAPEGADEGLGGADVVIEFSHRDSDREESAQEDFQMQQSSQEAREGIAGLQIAVSDNVQDQGDRKRVARDSSASEEIESAAELPPKRKKASSYYGVYAHNEADDDGKKWYIRGRLLPVADASPPRLIKGESVQYVPGGDYSNPKEVKVELLEYRNRAHKQVVSYKDKAECKRFAELGEAEHARLHREARKLSRNHERATGLELRPGQPVYVRNLARKALLLRVPGEGGVALVEGPNKEKSTQSRENIQLINYKPDPVDLEAFWRENTSNLPRQKDDFSKPAGYLRQQWENAFSDPEIAGDFIDVFEAEITERRRWREKAQKYGGIYKLSKVLLQRLRDDYAKGLDQLLDLKAQITKCKRTLQNPNFLLLCGGIAPEVTAYKRLKAAPIGIVVLQDINLHAVGVAVAGHPDVEFCIVVDRPRNDGRNVTTRKPGDIHILVDHGVIREVEVRTGGIHHASSTNPCQSFSLAGGKEGFAAENGQLLFDCATVVRNVEKSGHKPSYLFENVPSTHEITDQFNRYLPDTEINCFTACASMCSPCLRERKFATNIPPPICSVGPNESGRPPSLDGNRPELCAPSVVDGDKRMVHPAMKKTPCILKSNPTRHRWVWEQTDLYQNPVQTPPTPEEAERVMGYRGKEVGVTKFSAQKAVEKRIADHDFEKDGCLVSLKGCAEDPDFPVELVSPTQRLELLGNSECPTLLEAFLFDMQREFPPIVDDVDVDQE